MTIAPLGISCFVVPGLRRWVRLQITLFPWQFAEHLPIFESESSERRPLFLFQLSFSPSPESDVYRVAGNKFLPSSLEGNVNNIVLRVLVFSDSDSQRGFPCGGGGYNNSI